MSGAIAPTTVEMPEALPARRAGDAWRVDSDDVAVRLTNLDKVFWPAEGYTKADLLAYYWNIADFALPYVRGRPLTMKRMPDGAAGEFFYAKQVPDHAPEWVRTASVEPARGGRRIDYVLAERRADLLWLANLGCIELHPWHARIDDIGHPDYAFFDLDPAEGADFDLVRRVALHVRVVLDRLGLRSYPRTSGATGMQVYVPIDRAHTAAEVREWVRRVSRLVARADPEAATMEPTVADRAGRVYLDHLMNTEGRNIAATWSLRPEPAAPVATTLSWDEVESGVAPSDFTIATIWRRLATVGDVGGDLLAGGQDLHAAMTALGMQVGADAEAAQHRVVRSGPVAEGTSTRLERYVEMRDFAVTSEPPAAGEADTSRDSRDSTDRFVVQHHLARRLHHDLRFARDGVAVSWAIPKGLPDVPGIRHLAVQTEDHPLSYLEFSGEIPPGEYGAGAVRIWDAGTYETLTWEESKVTVRLHGDRHRGEYHLTRTDDDWLVQRIDEPAPDELPSDPPTLRPMLAVAADAPFDDPDWLFEVKWDGVRALATLRRPGGGQPGGTQLVTRAGNDVTVTYPELAGLWERLIARNAILDGEVVALDEGGAPSFQRLQRRMGVRDAAAAERLARRSPVTYVAFDLVALDGDSLEHWPLRERLERLDEVIVAGGRLARSEPIPGEGTALYAAARERGLEGVMAKRTESRYHSGRRSRDWRKIKVRRTVDAVVGGWIAGEGGRSGRLGSLLVGLHDDGQPDAPLRFVGRVGTGFDEAELDRLSAELSARASEQCPFVGPPAPPSEGRWVTPTLVCRVAYGEVTDAGLLRAPSYRGLQPATAAETCQLGDLRRA